MTVGRALAILLLAGAMNVPALAANAPVVIAHRGASGYVPEHTLLAVTTAHAMGADYIEQDVVLSADGVPVVLHDIHLETTTDVATRFPDRVREDGRWYAVDFSLAELRELSVFERRSRAGEPVYPGRFPQVDLSLRIPTLAEEIELITGLNASGNHAAGLYIEFKAPRFHAAAGLDIARAVLDVLAQHGLNQEGAPVFLQCFDPITLQRLHEQSLTPLPLIQLIGANDWEESDTTDYDAMRTAEGLDAIARYADGIGPWIPHLFRAGEEPSSLVRDAHARDLLVHPYTLRRDALAIEAPDFDVLQRKVLVEAGVDGAFTDFPDLTRDFIDTRWASPDSDR